MTPSSNSSTGANSSTGGEAEVVIDSNQQAKRANVLALSALILAVLSSALSIAQYVREGDRDVARMTITVSSTFRLYRPQSLRPVQMGKGVFPPACGVGPEYRVAIDNSGFRTITLTDLRATRSKGKVVHLLYPRREARDLAVRGPRLPLQIEPGQRVEYTIKLRTVDQIATPGFNVEKLEARSNLTRPAVHLQSLSTDGLFLPCDYARGKLPSELATKAQKKRDQVNAELRAEGLAELGLSARSGARSAGSRARSGTVAARRDAAFQHARQIIL